MIPHDINRERFDYLLGAGLKSGELKEFFKEKQQRLIMCGVKVQNLPTDAAAAKALVHQFSEKAHRVLSAWIQELEDEECSVGPDQWIPRYRAAEAFQVEFPREDMAAMARAGLKELYKDNPSVDWIRFLSTSPKTDTDEVVELVEPGIATPSEGEWISFGQWLCSLGTLDGVVNPVLREAAAILAKWDRRAPLIELTTEEGRRALPLIEKLIEDTQRSASPSAVRKGLRSGAPVTRAREADVDYLALPVIATRVHSPHSGPYMAKVEAFVDESGPFRLEEADLRQVVRTLGRLAIFPNKGFAEPRPNEAVMYRIESHVTNLPVQVRAREVLDSALIPVVRIPCSTKEAHQARRAIEDYARTVHARPAVFVTTDDVCLKPGVESLTRLAARDYDWVLDTWDHLEGVEVSSGTYVLAPLPPPTGRLSCAPLAAAAVRLLGDSQRRAQAGLTKAQANTLQDMLLDESLGIDDLSRARLAENVRFLAAAGQDYEELVRLLMTSSVVRADVDRLAELRVAELTAEKQKEARAIERLRQEREGLETKLRELRSETEKKSKDVRAAVVRAFKKASEKEIEALGEASVLLALIGHEVPSAVRGDGAPEGSRPETIVRGPVPASPGVSISKREASAGQVRDVLRKYGLATDTCERVERLLRAAVAVGLPVITRGSGARVLAEDLAPVISTGEITICEVPIGLIVNERLEARLGESTNGVVLLLDGNLSDISVYAPGLLDAAVAAAIGRMSRLAARPLVIALSSGPAGLPLPAELQELAVDLDLNVLGGAFAAEDRGQLQPQGALARRALKRFDTDAALSNLDLTPAVLSDLNWLLCQSAGIHNERKGA